MDELLDKFSFVSRGDLSDFIEDRMSSISSSIVAFLDFFTGSSGAGKDLKSGGKTKGFFLITKNSSLDSYFFPDNASFTF